MNAKRRKQAEVVLGAAMAVSGLIGSAGAADNTFTWIGPSIAAGNVSFSFASNWQGGIAPPLSPAAGDNTIVQFGGASPTVGSGSLATATIAINATGGSTNPADYELYGMHFLEFRNDANTSGSLTISTTGAGSRIIKLGAGGIVDDASAASSAGGSINIALGGTATDGRLILTADQTWTINNTTGNFVMRRPIEGVFTLVKDGAGTLQLTSNATNINVNGAQSQITGNARFNGTLDFRQGGIRLDTVGTQFASPDARIVVNTSNDVSLSASGSNPLDQAINGSLFLGGTGAFNVSGSWSITFNGPVSLLSDKTINQGINSSTGVVRNAIFTNTITGSFGVTKAGAGSMSFTGTNTYSGTTAVSNGWLAVDDPALQLGSGTTPVVLGNTGSVGTVGALVVRNSNVVMNRGLTINPGGGSIDFAGNLTINAPITSSNPASGSLVKAGAGILTANSINIGGQLTIPTSSVVVAPGSSFNRVGALSLSGGSSNWTSTLDLNNNNLVVDYTGASPLATVADQIKSGWASGSWTGQGIASGAAALSATGANLHKTALGFGEASALGISSFGGQSVDGDAIVVRYTYYGDANLDGTVNALDFNAIAARYGSSGSWINGDSNYDGLISSLDFDAVALNFNRTLSPSAALGTLVPEPISVATLAVLAGGVLARRRKTVTRSRI